MKKSLAVILLGSALLLPNHTVEASHSSKAVKTYSTQTVKCIEWDHAKSDTKRFEKKEYQGFFKNWKESVKKPELVIPEQGDVKVDTPQIEATPEFEDPPVVEQRPGNEQAPEVEQLPEIEAAPGHPAAPVPTPPVSETPPGNSIEQGAPNASISAIEQEVLRLTNIERQNAGLAPLAIDENLMNSAREKSKDMSKNNYFSHTSPTYGSPFDQMKTFGVTYRAAAENIAYGQRSAQEVVRAWMDSPGHRQNILTANFTHIGIGYDANGHYWTQQFIQK